MTLVTIVEESLVVKHFSWI